MIDLVAPLELFRVEAAQGPLEGPVNVLGLLLRGRRGGRQSGAGESDDRRD